MAHETIVVPSWAQVGPGQNEFFEYKICPVLAENRYARHGSAGEATADLCLDSREGPINGGRCGPAIVRCRPAKSLLFKAITHRDLDVRMPPAGRLEDSGTTDFEARIASGAPHPSTGDEAMTPGGAGGGRLGSRTRVLGFPSSPGWQSTNRGRRDLGWLGDRPHYPGERQWLVRRLPGGCPQRPPTYAFGSTRSCREPSTRRNGERLSSKTLRMTEYDGWTASGEAFGASPSVSALQPILRALLLSGTQAPCLA